jgi:hypothetical protein
VGFLFFVASKQRSLASWSSRKRVSSLSYIANVAMWASFTWKIHWKILNVWMLQVILFTLQSWPPRPC